MWQETASFLTRHPKVLGLTGDSLTFAGSILLSLEALFKKVQFVSIGKVKALVRYFPTAEDRYGKKLSPEEEERKWMGIWLGVSRIGAVLLTGGFGFPLASRILSE